MEIKKYCTFALSKNTKSYLMGRAFEYRKARKMKRWGNMARVFTRIGKEIEMAVKAGGADPTANPRLRLLMQNAKTENMPKENVERAIKRAISKDTADYKEIVYEGYGSGGVAFAVETATDNPTRTVANIRAAFNRCNGSLGTSGMTQFIFERKCNFKIAAKEGLDMDAALQSFARRFKKNAADPKVQRAYLDYQMALWDEQNRLDTALADKDAKWQSVVADRDAALADKDAEIARLLAQLGKINTD
jgi:YebC/PmpR family DNA-binding regulatory protein